MNVVQLKRPEIVRDPRGHLPPNDLDTERELIGYVLFRPVAYDVVAGHLEPQHFFSPLHQTLWRAIEAVAEEGAEPSRTAVRSYLLDRGQLTSMGGDVALERIMLETPAVSSLERAAARIRDFWRLREYGTKCAELAAKHYFDVGPLQEFLEAGVNDLERLAYAATREASVSLGTSIQETFAKYSTNTPPTGLETGLADFDAKLGGLFGGKVYVVGGRPGMGKSSFAFQIAGHVATTRDLSGARNGVLAVSMEMGHQEVSASVVCGAARVKVSDLRRNAVTPAGWQELTRAASWLFKAPLEISDASAQSPLEVRSRARRLAASWRRAAEQGDEPTKLALIVIDYVQLMNGRSLVGPKATREEEVSKCTKAIKELARDLDVPILLLSQIGRASERTKDKRPTMADLRESGAIEADADAVVILFREDYYLKERTPPEKRGLVEIMIEKNRDGAIGTAYAKFFGGYKLFAAWDGPLPDEEAAS